MGHADMNARSLMASVILTFIVTGPLHAGQRSGEPAGRTYRPLHVAEITVPPDWREVQLGETVLYAPPDGFVRRDDGGNETIVGVQVEVFHGRGVPLEQLADAVVAAMAPGNVRQELIRRRRGLLAGADAIVTELSNINGVTRQREIILASLRALDSGRVLLVTTTVPERSGDPQRDEALRAVNTLRLLGTSHSPGASEALVGTWRSQGVILTLHADGRFDRVSNSSYGSFGGLVGVDDSGTYEVRGQELILNGMMTRRCEFSLSGGTLTLCRIAYRRE